MFLPEASVMISIFGKQKHFKVGSEFDELRNAFKKSLKLKLTTLLNINIFAFKQMPLIRYCILYVHISVNSSVCQIIIVCFYV